MAKIVDLFAGAGGWSLGLKKAGHEIILAIDNWDVAIKTYKANFPEVPVLNIDLREFNEDHELFYLIKKADVIVGSPPCKGFSLLNKKRDDELELVETFFRIAKGKPFIMENIARVGRLLKESGKTFEGKGAVISMGDYGVPQVRRRYIHSNFIDIKNIRKIKGEIRPYIKKLMSIPIDGDKPQHSERVVKIMRSVKNGESARRFGTYYRVPLRGLSQAVVNVTKSMMIHPKEDRRLTIREAAILQTFPENYIFLGSTNQKAEMIGNAVPPKFSELVGYTITEVLNK